MPSWNVDIQILWDIKKGKRERRRGINQMLFPPQIFGVFSFVDFVKKGVWFCFTCFVFSSSFVVGLL